MNKILRLFVFPVVIFLWVVGWVLIWIVDKKKEGKTT